QTSVHARSLDDQRSGEAGDVTLHDLGSRDDTFVELIQRIRRRLLEIGGVEDGTYEAVLMQGSGTFVVESVISSLVPRDGTFLVDAMSSFGGMPMDIRGCGIDLLVSSANKCIQGVPGFGFVLARRALLLYRGRGSRPQCQP